MGGEHRKEGEGAKNARKGQYPEKAQFRTVQRRIGCGRMSTSTIEERNKSADGGKDKPPAGNDRGAHGFTKSSKGRKSWIAERRLLTSRRPFIAPQPLKTARSLLIVAKTVPSSIAAARRRELMLFYRA
jgi:hypothetical protein